MIYAISDLHLSILANKPMDRFGQAWVHHADKIKEDWLSKVQNEDLVLLPGDFSWGMNLQEADPDLVFIGALPGKKVLVKGNHDYWWHSITKLSTSYGQYGMVFIQNDCYNHDPYAICGTRGWKCPGSFVFEAEDEGIYKRELHRLKLSLEQAPKGKPIIVMLHFPPTNEFFEESGFIKLLQTYPVKHVVYGHLHGEKDFQYGLQGVHQGIHYHLCSSDFLDFKLICIDE